MPAHRRILGFAAALTLAIAVPASAATAEGGQSDVGLKAPTKANGSFKVTISWTAGPDDHTVFVYRQPKNTRCFKSGEDERNDPSGKIHLVLERDNVGGHGSAKKTVKEAAGGKTRLCAYLVGYNDVGAPHEFATKVVG